MFQDRQVVAKKGRFTIDLSRDRYRVAFANFSNAAEAFSMSLSDPFDRRFACRYFTYLQDMDAPKESKPFGGRPSCRLIRAELERLFKSHFCAPAAA